MKTMICTLIAALALVVGCTQPGQKVGDTCRVPGTCITGTIPAATLGLVGGTGIAVDGSTVAVKYGIPTSDLTGTIAIDAGTAGDLPSSRLAIGGALTCPAADTTCGLTQTMAPSGYAPTALVLHAQYPATYSGGQPSAVSQTPGSIFLDISSPRNIGGTPGQEAFAYFSRNGSAIGGVGYDPTENAYAMWLGQSVCGGVNFAIAGDGTNLLLNTVSGTGAIDFMGAGSVREYLSGTDLIVTSGINLDVGGGPLGGGAGVITLHDGTCPTSAITGGGVLCSSGGDLQWCYGSTDAGAPHCSKLAGP